jgi:hypothetical protein
VIETILGLAAQNLLSPIILFFALGLGSGIGPLRPDDPGSGREIPVDLFALRHWLQGRGERQCSTALIRPCCCLSGRSGAVVRDPVRWRSLFCVVMTLSSTVDAAAVAGHYGSISIVTFVAATSVLQSQGIASEGYMVAVAAVMEAPAILSALWIVARFSTSAEAKAA